MILSGKPSRERFWKLSSGSKDLVQVGGSLYLKCSTVEYVAGSRPEAEFLEEIGTKVPPPPSKSGSKLVCNVNYKHLIRKPQVLRTLKIMPRNLYEIVRS
jgi:hypothetical protein